MSARPRTMTTDMAEAAAVAAFRVAPNSPHTAIAERWMVRCLASTRKGDYPTAGRHAQRAEQAAYRAGATYSQIADLADSYLAERES